MEPSTTLGTGITDSHRVVVERTIAQIGGTGADLSLRDMADIAYLSPHHFARTFRRVTGISPGEFQCALRLQRAKRLLLTTDLSASGVCFEVGYGSLGIFTSRFTHLVGVSPGRDVDFEVVGPELPARARTVATT